MNQPYQSLQATSHGLLAQRWWVDLAILTVIGGLFLFSTLGSISFLDPDEGMYGSIARELAEEGNWITPQFNGVRYLNKPPLQFWLAGLTISAFGPSEWAVRLWSALPAFGTALLIWRMGTWLYGSSGGLLGALIFVTSVGVFRYVRVAATDFLLVFSITLAIFGFLKAFLSGSTANTQSLGVGMTRGSRGTGLILFYIGLALGVLSKGFIGVVFPMVIVGLFVILANGKWQIANGGTARKLGSRKAGMPKAFKRPSLLAQVYSLFANRHSLLGFSLFIIMVLPWHLLSEWKNPGFFQFYVIDNQILRFFNTRAFLEDDVPIQTLSFLVVTFLWFFPWSLLLPAAFRQGFPRFHQEMELNEVGRLLTGTWVLGILSFFCLSMSKLEHYSLPALPALSLMVGGRWGNALVGTRYSALGLGGTLNKQWSKGYRRFDGLKWCLGVGAFGCFLVGSALLLFGGQLTSRALLTGLGEVNVYYRILIDQGMPFPFDSLSPFIHILKQLGILLVLGFPISYLLVSRSPIASFMTLLISSGIIAFLVFKLDKVVEPHHSTRPVAKALLAKARPDDVIVHEGSLEYGGGLPFYTGRRIRVLNGKRGSLDFGSRFAEDENLFMENGPFTRLWGGPRRVFLVTGYQVRQSVVENLPPNKSFFIGRYGSRLLYTNRPVINGQ